MRHSPARRRPARSALGQSSVTEVSSGTQSVSMPHRGAIHESQAALADRRRLRAVAAGDHRAAGGVGGLHRPLGGAHARDGRARRRGRREHPLDRARRRLRALLPAHRRPHLAARPGARRAPLLAQAGGVRLQRHPRAEVAARRHQAARADAAARAGLASRRSRRARSTSCCSRPTAWRGWSTTCSRAAACSPRKRPLALPPLDVADFFAGYFAEAAPRVEAQGVHLAWQLDTRGARARRAPTPSTG